MSNEKETFKPTISTQSTSINDMFGQILKQKLENGAVEEVITNKVDSFINECVSDAFRSYGDIGKSIKDAITQSITPNLKELGYFPSYHHFVMKSIKARVEKFQDEKLQHIVDKELEEIFKELPEQITLSWVLDKIKEDIKEDDSDFDGGQLTLLIRNDGGSFTYVSIGKEDCMNEYQCEYRIGLHHGEIFSLDIKDKNYDNDLIVNRIYGFEKQLFKAYTMKATLTLDKGMSASSYDIEVESNEYDDY
ncbi:hypothetical protein CW745_14030 [Psychromonas sp. psych-6C06]|uniref:hypothetical protein n=1 Tax=Psychromonas sp. psych-6C06 TaxID=2058089 RepID=UPI000C33C4ED|nr:hypothetical protein [Psychromonas sp. psych-6C06]PKF60645.1 hypothetical protein CW745_14030 [Psychromonas sp. psych-6C06]